MIIFSSSQKASNCIGWQAHTERYAVMNGVFTEVVFLCEAHVCSYIAHHIITTELLQAKTQGLNSLCSGLESKEMFKKTTTITTLKRTPFVLLSKN